MYNRKHTIKHTFSLVVLAGLALGLGACGTKETETKPAEEITIRILENDTAKKEGYLDELLNAFNEKYKDQGITAVDANMDEYTDLATNGPYGYGPDVIYQANDKLMTYASNKHILPVSENDFECFKYIPEAAKEAFTINVEGTAYLCGIPVNIQEPMLFYRKT